MTPTPRQLIARDIFLKEGYSPNGAAAIVGNLVGESGKNLNSTLYRVHADHGSGGIAEWRLERKDALVAFGGPNAALLETQCAFVIKELKESYPILDEQLRNTNRSVANLTANFCWYYERPNRQLANLDGRIAAAEDLANSKPSTPAPPVVLSGAAATSAGYFALLMHSLHGWNATSLTFVAITMAFGIAVVLLVASRATKPQEKEDPPVTLSDLNAKLDMFDSQFKTMIADLTAAIEANKTAAAVAVSADLDTVGSRVDTLQAELAAALASVPK